MKKKALFIDRDGTLIREPADEQIDSIEKFSFVPGCLTALADIVKAGDYELVMVSNQDGLGTAAYPQEVFDTFQRLLLDTLDSVGVKFDDILLDRSFPEDGLPTRKPGIGMMGAYLTGDYDLPHSFMIGDRATDAEFARNMGCQALILSESLTWTDIRNRVLSSARCAEVRRTTRETDIDVWMGLDGTGQCEISTGLGFFDHGSAIARTSGDFVLTGKGQVVSAGDVGCAEGARRIRGVVGINDAGERPMQGGIARHVAGRPLILRHIDEFALDTLDGFGRNELFGIDYVFVKDNVGELRHL